MLGGRLAGTSVKKGDKGLGSSVYQPVTLGKFANFCSWFLHLLNGSKDNTYCIGIL